MTTTTDIELEISGMTCASCANRIERKLNKLDGVVATVNYATEKAKVTFPADSRRRTWSRPSSRPATAPPAATRRGGARILATRTTRPGRCGSVCWLGRADGAGDRDGDDPGAAVHQLAVALADPRGAGRGVGGLAVPPCRVANLRHGTSTMDTLISLGTLAALGWSVYALFWGTAGTPGMTHPFELTVERTDGAGNIYLEAAAGVTTFILAGRYFEARSKRRAGAALRALAGAGRQGGRGAPRRS